MSIKKNKENKHSYFLKLALLQAKKNLGNTKENPSVGSIIVKNDIVLGVGSTGINGRPHAEHQAFKSTKGNIKNSDMYITLEPCSHYGKTPPCVNKIIKKKIKRVFYPIYDLDKRSHKKSINLLKKKGIKVSTGINKNKFNEFYKSYLKFKKENLPYVAAKIAISKDYFIKNIENKWITNEASRSRGHILRSKHDCLITTYNTIKQDNPMLNCRVLGLEKKSPTRVILDKNLSIKTNSNVIKTSNKYPTIVIFNNYNKKKIRALKYYKVKLIKKRLNASNQFDLNDILLHLKNKGFSRIFVESGAKLINELLKKKLIDKLYLFYSNKSLNKNGRINVKKKIISFIKNRPFTNENVNLNGDKLFIYRLK